MPYPILLDLHGRRVVVVGGGNVAARKVGDLLAAGAQVTVISPMLNDTLAPLHDQFDWQESTYTPGMLAVFQPLLVFATTDSPQVNQQVAAEAQALHMLVNTTDDSRTSDFTSMSTIERGDITVGLATGGASPALTAHLRQLLESVIGEEYIVFARWLGELRPLVKARVAAERRAALWQAIIRSEALARLRDGDEVGARAIIDALIHNEIHESD